MRRAPKGCFKLVVIVCLVRAVMAVPAALKKPDLPLRRIYIKESTGQVLAWAPWASSWTPVTSGIELWESTLIQVGPRSQITFEMRSADGFSGLDSDVIDVTINHPAVLRLDSQVLRKVHLSTFFIPELPEITQAKGSDNSLLYRKFSEAWERFAALVVPGAIKKSWFPDLNKGEDQDATVAAKSKRIRLFSPVNDMMLVVDKLPAEFTVLWQKVPDPNVTYDVMIWRIDEPRRPPTAVTRFDFHYAKLFHDGDYYVQVATSDGRWQSVVKQVHIMLPMQGRIAHTTNSQAGVDPLPLALPPKSFAYIARQMPAELTFTWGLGSLGNNATYQFVLRDAAGKELVRRMTSDRLLRLKINRAGEYNWQVEGTPQPTDRAIASAKVYSEVRAFRLQAVSDLADKRLENLFDLLLANGKSTVVYTEQEF